MDFDIGSFLGIPPTHNDSLEGPIRLALASHIAVLIVNMKGDT